MKELGTTIENKCTEKLKAPVNSSELFQLLSDENNVTIILENIKTSFDKVFKQFENWETFIKSVTDDSITFNGRAFLDAEISWKLYNDFINTFYNVIKSVIWETLMNRLSKSYLKKTTYTIWITDKKFDNDPFIDDNLERWEIWDRTIWLFSNKRTDFNNIEYVYTIFPKSIIEELKQISKNHIQY